MTDAQIKAKFDRLHAEWRAKVDERKAKGVCVDCGCESCDCKFQAWARNRQSTANAHGAIGPSMEYLRAQWNKMQVN